jgi:lactoylglutathione lyase
MVRLVGINHVALEVGDLDEALDWYGRLFEFELRGRAGDRMAFIDIGDQFIALASGRTQAADAARHFGLVVDDKEAVRERLRQEGIPVQASGSLDFTDPWGNHVQVVAYEDVQFTKSPEILRAMELGELSKSERAVEELRAKGLTGGQFALREDVATSNEALAEIHVLSPTAKVFVVGYPEITPLNGYCPSAIPWTTRDLNWFRTIEQEGNALKKAGALANHDVYVDTFTPSIGHNACEPVGKRWIEPLIGSLTGVPVHPNAAGQVADAFDVGLSMVFNGALDN